MICCDIFGPSHPRAKPPHKTCARYGDTLFNDNWTTKISAYNKETYERTGDTIRNYDDSFSIYDYFFGGKDLIIQYVDCVQRFKNQARNSYTADEFIKLVSENDIRTIERKVIKLSGVFHRDTNDNTVDNNLFLKQGDYLIQVNMAATDIKESPIGDSLIILGKVSKINKQSKVVILENGYKIGQY